MNEQPARRPSLALATLLSLLALLLLSAASGAGTLENLSLDIKHRLVVIADSRRQPALVPSPRPATDFSRGSALGMNVFLEQEVDPERRQRSLELLKSAHVGWIRQQLPWDAIEPVRQGLYVDPNVGGSTWTRFDDIVQRANAVGLRVMLRLDRAPRWAQPAGAIGAGPPARDADYWNFVETVALRYRGRVDAYQIWNEPNLASEWGGRPPDAPAYERLLAGAASRVRAADPHAVVVAAAMAPTLTNNAEATDDQRYLQQLYDAGVRGSFDVLAVQAYGLRGGPDDPRIDLSEVTYSRPRLVRALMDRNGDADRPIWATEMGWDVPPATLAIQRFGSVTPTLQARYTLRALVRAHAQWPWMQVQYLWYFKRADKRDQGEDWYWFALATPDFELSPAFRALQDFGGLASHDGAP